MYVSCVKSSAQQLPLRLCRAAHTPGNAPRAHYASVRCSKDFKLGSDGADKGPAGTSWPSSGRASCSVRSSTSTRTGNHWNRLQTQNPVYTRCWQSLALIDSNVSSNTLQLLVMASQLGSSSTVADVLRDQLTQCEESPNNSHAGWTKPWTER